LIFVLFILLNIFRFFYFTAFALFNWEIWALFKNFLMFSINFIWVFLHMESYIFNLARLLILSVKLLRFWLVFFFFIFLVNHLMIERTRRVVRIIYFLFLSAKTHILLIIIKRSLKMSFLHLLFHNFTNFIINHIFFIFLRFQILLILAIIEMLLRNDWIL